MFIIKERMTQALRYFKDSTEHQILAQVWALVKSGNKYVLSTPGQPFVLSPNSNGLQQYRTVSPMYSFSVDGESEGSLGPVFRQKLPEWTPDVQYYSSKEYSRINHAKNYNVHGTLALPVFEPSGHSRVDVLELIMTSKKINYAPEVDKVCKALEMRAGKLWSQIDATFKQMDTAGTELDSLRRLPWFAPSLPIRSLDPRGSTLATNPMGLRPLTLYLLLTLLGKLSS